MVKSTLKSDKCIYLSIQQQYRCCTRVEESVVASAPGCAGCDIAGGKHLTQFKAPPPPSAGGNHMPHSIFADEEDGDGAGGLDDILCRREVAVRFYSQTLLTAAARDSQGISTVAVVIKGVSSVGPIISHLDCAARKCIGGHNHSLADLIMGNLDVSQPRIGVWWIIGEIPVAA